MTDSMLPMRYRVTGKWPETRDTITLMMQPAAEPIAPCRPGQFTMLYAFGVGEVPISVSGALPEGGTLVQTIRAVGAVTDALCAMSRGDVVGVRGPFGAGWQLPRAAGRDLVVVGGGIGLAPLRSLLLAALADRDRYGRIALLTGARTPDDLVFASEFESWRSSGATVEVTVDHADSRWTGHVGVVTELIRRADFDPANAVAFVCGPEVMMRFAAKALLARGMAARDVQLSLERNMRCGIAVCGHCQLGPLLVCRDGPVVSYQQAQPLLAVKEL